MKKYIRIQGGEATHLRVELSYSLGGMNVFTYKNERRGYYLSVVPVVRKGNMESFVAFSGVKNLVKPVARKSAKAEAEAEQLSAQEERELVRYIMDKHHYTFAKEEQKNV